MALLLLSFWLSLFSTSMFNDMSESIRLSVDCEFLFVPCIVDLMNSLMFRLTVCELIRKLWANGWLESGMEDETVGTFCVFDSIDSTLGSSFLLNLLTLLLMLFLKAFATRSPTAREYDGGGEYFGGASLLTSIVLARGKGTTIGCAWFKFCWHKRRIGKCKVDDSSSSIGGRNKSSIRWR